MYFKPQYILIIFFTIIIDYFAGILIQTADPKHKKIYLILSLATNIGILAYFKYFNFLAENLNLIASSWKGPQIPLITFLLPIGLSFHTFQAMSYTIEVYRGNQSAEKHLGIYALYVMFYPQMVAGPIERPQHILPQLHRVNKFNKDTFMTGLLFMMIGFLKKVVIADRLGLSVDPVFLNPHVHSSYDLLLATYFFAFQIYCDFSGYTDIAIGAALTLGIVLMKNFNMPYLAANIAEFWKRWHISLSTWFRDYVYIPLGGNRVSFSLMCVNLFIVFTLSGLWHGANWKYIIWGLIHGTVLIIYQLLKKIGVRLNGFNFIKWLITFNLVCLAWIFFRASNVLDGFYIVDKIFSGLNIFKLDNNIFPLKSIIYSIILIFALVGGEWYMNDQLKFSNRRKLLFIIGLGLTCYFFGVFTESQFIYFQF